MSSSSVVDVKKLGPGICRSKVAKDGRKSIARTFASANWEIENVARAVNDKVYEVSEAWYGWVFAPGGFVLGPSCLFAAYVLGTYALDKIRKSSDSNEEK
jgi:hypothetical protein